MKRFLLLSLIVIFSLAVKTQTNTSIGGASGDWSDGGTLPIRLLAFNAVKLTPASSWVTWKLADFSSSAEKFEIQRAGDDKKFITLGVVSGNETDHSYNYTDNDLKTGTNFYRLRMTDKDAVISYSKTVAIMNNVKGLLITSLAPNVIDDKTTLKVTSSNQQKLDIVISDIQGRVMLRRNVTITAGNTNIEMSLARLATGVYLLTGTSAEGKTSTIRFIKQ